MFRTITIVRWRGSHQSNAACTRGHQLARWLRYGQAIQDWPGGMKEYLTALLLVRLPSTLYTHWMRYPSNARTLSIPVMVMVCSARVWTVYTAPGKAVPMSWPLSSVPLCIHSGAESRSLCLQMRVTRSEQCPWSSRETLMTAVRCRKQTKYVCICEQCTMRHCVYTAATQYSITTTVQLNSIHTCIYVQSYNQATLVRTK